MKSTIQKKISREIYLLILLIPVFIIAGLTTTAKAQTTTETNRQLVTQGFDHWTKGTGSVFDLLSEDVQWTIAGSSPQAKTYLGKKQFMDELIIPLNDRLSKKIVPAVRGIYADGDMVIVIWDGKATAKDGKPYNASYCWNLQIRDGKIVKAYAFLDNAEFADLMNRLPGNK
ncbi:MAG TPA: nuclear transport factor 2 family protein [Pedobacter sp.]